MNRRDFIKLSGSGLLTLFLSGCGLSALTNKPQTTANANDHIGENKMKIVVITGSSHKAGTSALLADKFIEGATNAGHEVFRFNSAFEDIHHCQSCDHCGMNGPCIQDLVFKTMILNKHSCQN